MGHTEVGTKGRTLRCIKLQKTLALSPRKLGVESEARACPLGPSSPMGSARACGLAVPVWLMSSL